jgi:hypothetical protein
MAHNDDFFADGQGGSTETYKPSSHQFTDPIRVFKANDPYYWEVDNIPLEQLQENLLWLKDQVGVALTSGPNRSNFDELLPTAGTNRTVNVSPGRFMGRVNNAYQTGISTLKFVTAANAAGPDVNEIEITTPDDTLKKLAGIVTTSILGDNGLYDYVQHHVTAPAALYNLNWAEKYTSFVQNRKDADGQVYDLQTIKLALWKQGNTVKNYDDGTGASNVVDLQQLAVEFTRVWGAPFRTSLVNIPNAISMTIPSFDSSAYSVPSGTVYTPAVRVDLLFIYTHPIDATVTPVLTPGGTGTASQISSPQLGLVKGAGVISLNGKGAFAGYDVDSDFFETPPYTTASGNAANYFESSGAFDANNFRQTASVVADLKQTSMGVDNTFANFPSPDDLLNAAPYITDGAVGSIASKNRLQLIGQSVLPIAYIFVRKESTTITDADIFDIRPFFRTAELTYNERAGLAAANPPTSLANPVVSRYQLADNTKKLRRHLLDVIDIETPDQPRPVGSGYVFGGLRFGPEGVLARLSADQNVNENQRLDVSAFGDNAAITDFFVSQGVFPPFNGAVIPDYPDWDLPGWANNLGDGGFQRNDYFNVYYQQGSKNTFTLSKDSEWNIAYDTGHVNRMGWSNDRRTGVQSFMVRKRVEMDSSLIPWMQDYTVRLAYSNCCTGSNDNAFYNFSRDEDQSMWLQFDGLYIEKYATYFNIVATWVNGDPFDGTNDNGPGGHWDSGGGYGGSPMEFRTTERWSRVMVTNNDTMLNQTTTTDWMGTKPMFRGEFSTYPTVYFEIIGYTEEQLKTINMKMGTDNIVKLS